MLYISDMEIVSISYIIISMYRYLLFTYREKDLATILLIRLYYQALTVRCRKLMVLKRISFGGSLEMHKSSYNS